MHACAFLDCGDLDCGETPDFYRLGKWVFNPCFVPCELNVLTHDLQNFYIVVSRKVLSVIMTICCKPCCLHHLPLSSPIHTLIGVICTQILFKDH